MAKAANDDDDDDDEEYCPHRFVCSLVRSCFRGNMQIYANEGRGVSTGKGEESYFGWK